MHDRPHSAGTRHPICTAPPVLTYCASTTRAIFLRQPLAPFPRLRTWEPQTLQVPHTLHQYWTSHSAAVAPFVSTRHAGALYAAWALDTPAAYDTPVPETA
eukprot:1780098-Rhodomonas_salina.1